MGSEGERGHDSGEEKQLSEDRGLIWKRRIQPRVGLKVVEPVLYSIF